MVELWKILCVLVVDSEVEGSLEIIGKGERGRWIRGGGIVRWENIEDDEWWWERQGGRR